MSTRLRRGRRILATGLAAALIALVALFSYRSYAFDASLSVTPDKARQNDTVTLIGRAFSADEIVSVWVTYPDLSVFAVAEVPTNGDGNFDYPYLPDFLSATSTPVGRYVYTAHGKSSGREVYATLDVAVGQAPGPSRDVTVAVNPSNRSQGSTFSIRGEGYGSGEDLALWLTYPDSTVQDLGRVTTGPEGSFSYDLQVGGAPTGGYAFTARGLSTGRNGIGTFQVNLGDRTTPRGAAALTLRPTAEKQRNYAIFDGSGFLHGEIISVWATLPDNSVEYVGDVQADEIGAFSATLYISEQEPAGRYVYTAYGNKSQLRATARFTLNPGP